MPNIMREWTQNLTLRQQAVLLGAIRGCDGAPKDDPSKDVLWALRWFVLNPSDPNADPHTTKTFMGLRFGWTGRQSLGAFMISLDQYPFHFIMHVMHACEIIGYKHPDMHVRQDFWDIYNLFCIAHTHTNAETEEQMDHRLRDR